MTIQRSDAAQAVLPKDEIIYVPSSFNFKFFSFVLWFLKIGTYAKIYDYTVHFMPWSYVVIGFKANINFVMINNLKMLH